MGILEKFEQRVDKMVNGAFAKAFKSEVQPVEIASRLQKEMDERAAVVSRARTVVPNEFVIHLSAEDYERLSVYAEALTSELADLVTEYAADQRYSFLGPVNVYLAEDSVLSTGVFRATSQATAGPQRAPAVSPSAPAAAAYAPARGTYRPRLLAAGQEIPLSGPKVILGRGNDVGVRLEDPGVSRHHAEIRLGPPALIRDLDSTNGTFVDGKKITQQELSDGAVIRLGSTTITFRAY